ncbi:MAG: hypothetical protein NTZ56_24695 [Acidobacteria bacterium]|nr:hypothetical protein [Acidobacteriota bacterium]
MPDIKGFADVKIIKAGVDGRPTAQILVSSDIGVDQLSKVIAGVTRNKDLRKLLGLKACLACRSGFNLDIRDQFINELRVDLQQIGG